MDVSMEEGQPYLSACRISLDIGNGDGLGVDLHPGRSHAERLQPLPPRHRQLGSATIQRRRNSPVKEPFPPILGILGLEMDLDHDLPDRQRRTLEIVHHPRQDLVLGALDVDFEDVHVVVSVLLHQGLDGVEGRAAGHVVRAGESDLLEVSPGFVGWGEL